MHDDTQRQHSHQQLQICVVLYSADNAQFENYDDDDDVCDYNAKQDARHTRKAGLKSFLWTIGLL